ncbi:MAG TPA: DUF192 domain-containing protein [Candidatus Binatia bacterium]|jgi:uncharacterized membrane protein (UPF0127 family)
MRLMFALVISLAIFTAVSGCQTQPKVSIVGKNGREIAFQVEIADTPAKREMGLQYRRELALDQGMIFLFPTEEQQSFWMKNTPLPLDMIFISAEQKIVGIIENTVPFSLEARSVSGRSQSVLEINAGLSRRYGFKAGDAVRFQGFSAEGATR